MSPTSHVRALMLVSQRVDRALREEVLGCGRPRPEYLALEDVGVDLLDWTRLRWSPSRRSAVGSTVHAIDALRVAGRYDVVFSDGEHVGLPLGLMLRAVPRRPRHVMLGHRLTTNTRKRSALTLLARAGCVDRILVHSQRQRLAAIELGFEPSLVHVIPYFADEAFWQPDGAGEGALLVSAGIECRDYVTLAAACSDLSVKVVVARGSLHSPLSHARQPVRWPDNFKVAFADQRSLRDLYRRATVVVVPLTATDFQAGITTVLEAMAVGKPVVVTQTEGMEGMLPDGAVARVPVGDTAALRAAILRLLDAPEERQRLARSGGGVFHSNYSLRHYTSRLLGHVSATAES